MTATTTSLQRPTGRRRPRLAGVLVAGLVIAAGSFAWSALRPGTPAQPTTGSAIGGADAPAVPVVGSLEQIDHSIAAWTKNLAANPKDYLSATNLAILYHGRGRLSADLADQERALEAARTALAVVPGDPGIRGLEAAIRLTLHDFAGAYTLADDLVRSDPSRLGALATRFDAELELGRVDAARTDLAMLAGATSGPAVDIRAARLASVGGDPAGALGHARDALAAASAGGDDGSPDVGFYQYAVGEYARLAGDAATARSAFSAALALRPTDVAALIGLARIDAADGRTDAAVAGLRAATAIAPLPEALALLGDLLADRGDASGADAQYATIRFIERLGQVNATVFDRVLLRFELDHGGATEGVLAAARASLAARPDWTGHDTLAWALYRLGRFEEAAAEIDLARGAGTADARLLYHAGAIRLAIGDVTGGRDLLASALALGPALDPIERAEATRLLTN